MAYGPSRADLMRRATSYVDKILKGAKPAGLPVEQPTKFGLIINLKTARSLGIAIPPSIHGAGRRSARMIGPLLHATLAFRRAAAPPS
jgi:ABC-type uncharacterized transport system substrate-binding protein